MADQKLTALTEETAPVLSDILYMVDDPAGVPASRKVTIANVLSVGGADAGVNLIKNSPGQIVTDGAEPQWWDDVASATITDEDAAGEGIPDMTERVFKVVTIANDVYGYQTFTLADEELLDAGNTVVSLSCYVYCGTANKASIGIYGANLGLQESSQAGASAWELLTVPNITLNAADASVQVRLIADTDTAYFTMPMLTLGSNTATWRPRGQRFVATAGATQYDLNTTGDVAWSDTDCTANSDPLAVGVFCWVRINEPDGTLGSTHNVAHSDTVVGSDATAIGVRVRVVGHFHGDTCAYIRCDDSQVVRYSVAEADADADVRALLILRGYWMWA